MSERCEYGALFEDMIRDQFTFGLRDEALQKKMLESDLGLGQVTEKALAHEAARHGVAAICDMSSRLA